MKTKAKHTPTPWTKTEHWNGTGKNAYLHALTIHGNGRTIGPDVIFTLTTYKTKDEREQLVRDAALIVKAVNNHAHLVEALRIIRDSDGDKEDMREMAHAAIERLNGNPLYTPS